ncbi:hypothetical protein TNCT_318891 [Trichonephila clavata]|uniref:Uncharacterized protein n=1 Tax=Trichonephila clavata TaxID=2740835 RepID=A0A8X6J416_TRICU|nr:hypothetical protein TNCT_318891 [Trichonephila clavata]
MTSDPWIWNSGLSPPLQLSTCEQLKFNRAQLAEKEIFRYSKQTYVEALRNMSYQYPEEPFYARALAELHEIEETMAIVVSDITFAFPPYTTPGCPHHEKHQFTQEISPQTSNINIKSKTSNEGKDDLNFEYPPLRKLLDD